MAVGRINVYDSIYRDPKFIELCIAVGSIEAAIGSLVLAWAEAQQVFKNGQSTVPIEALRSRLKHIEALISSGFIKPGTDGTAYVRGSSDAFSYIAEQKAGGRKGGIKSAQVRKTKREGSPSKPSEPHPRVSKPSQAFQPSTSTSTSTSSIQIATQSGAPPCVVPSSPNPVGLWIKAWAKKYGGRYPLNGKDEAILTQLGKRHGPEECEKIFACYLAIADPLYEKANHPLSLLIRDMARISLAAQTGVDPSKPKPFDYSKLKD